MVQNQINIHRQYNSAFFLSKMFCCEIFQTKIIILWQQREYQCQSRPYQSSACFRSRRGRCGQRHQIHGPQSLQEFLEGMLSPRDLGLHGKPSFCITISSLVCMLLLSLTCFLILSSLWANFDFTTYLALENSASPSEHSKTSPRMDETQTDINMH